MQAHKTLKTLTLCFFSSENYPWNLKNSFLHLYVENRTKSLLRPCIFWTWYYWLMPLSLKIGYLWSNQNIYFSFSFNSEPQFFPQKYRNYFLFTLVGCVITGTPATILKMTSLNFHGKNLFLPAQISISTGHTSSLIRKRCTF